MSQPRDDRQDDLFCPALEEIINLRHPMVRLAAAIDWGSWRDGEQIAALLQESLSVAHRTGAIESKDLERVVVDTTVQEKAIAHPTDARRMRRNYSSAESNSLPPLGRSTKRFIGEYSITTWFAKRDLTQG